MGGNGGDMALKKAKQHTFVLLDLKGTKTLFLEDENNRICTKCGPGHRLIMQSLGEGEQGLSVLDISPAAHHHHFFSTVYAYFPLQ